MKNHDPRGRLAPVAALCAAHALWSSPAAAQMPVGTTQLEPVHVTGSPLRNGMPIAASATLAGEGLVLRRASTLGETLDGLTGVAATAFGPNASRPVIRGQDGERVRMLGNGGASLDVSALSFDHAVPIEPLVVERIDVLRGPAALLYGGSAIGGVVNAIDNRIPRAALATPRAVGELRIGGAADERSVGALVEAGSGAFALHADAHARRTDDLRVPAFDRPVDGGTERRDRVANSASRAEGGALGASMLWAGGRLGASVDSYRNRYGIVVEDDVSVRMQRDRLALALEQRDLAGPWRELRVQAQYSDYRHDEVEGDGTVGTRFANRGGDGRVELEHATLPWGGGTLRGVLGAQAESARFSALGEEAFVPRTRTRQAALFLFEEWRREAWTLQAGLRAERVSVASAGDEDPLVPRFGAAAKRQFSLHSTAAGVRRELGGAWQLSAQLAYNERAPSHAELYANGVHVATATFERGDPALARERGANAELALHWKRGDEHARLGAYTARHANYVVLAATGEPDVVTDDGDSVPVYAFSGVPARFSGLEAEGLWRLLDGAHRVDLEGRFDHVRGSRRDTGEPLPRLAPWRTTLALQGRQAAWQWRAELVHAARQSRVPAGDVPTDGHTLLHLSAGRAFSLEGLDGLAFLRIHNVGNVLATSATSIVTVRELSPLPGRSVMLGVRLAL